MSKKAKVEPPTALPTALLCSVVGYVESQEDATGLLVALPPAELGAPLAALRELMTTPMAFDGQWPTVDMGTISEENLHLVVDALPAIPGLLLPPRRSVHERHLPALLAALPSKLEAVSCFLDKEWLDMPEFRVVIPLCTRLKDVELGMSHLEATLLPPSVHKLTVFLAPGMNDPPFDPLAQCLQTGHVTDLGLNDFNSATSADAIAAMLATTTSVTNLELKNSEAVIDALIAARRPLHHLKAVQLDLDTRLLRGDIRDFMALLDVSNLTHLDAGGLNDFNCLLPFLSPMPLLEELALRLGKLTLAPDALMATPLPSLKVLTVQRVSMDAASFETFLLWASNLPNLAKVHWFDMDRIPVASLGLFLHVIGLWTHRLSVVSLRSCNFSGHHDYRYETLGLLLSTRPVTAPPLLLDLKATFLNRDTLRVTDVMALLDALDVRPDITLQLNVNADDEAAIAAYADSKHISMEILARPNPLGTPNPLEPLDCRFYAC
ncbi:hypothetical protein SPRG_03335 [Saprolegnia parasitica CBS 223.65]|uniref:Uncharacterized protein n=1 Tax=Saprolegnia parasitica (strain CBS 223.65) TaxID=695850 RepID=A0A067CZ97_SAPPC|nr:hypothetical protein SPRG_03335 [Saprolegnia parasitica CBS 223.65]KDO32117.1 hypothetical protein SPRG_03335 [Saprolegnia parasitica CBS 223.65]|eukprot:XP_012197302.1 hypothetical protein SPRG_03335 [Saprolegnia parasitica CBS 223.65]